jgi:hypothetical protein
MNLQMQTIFDYELFIYSISNLFPEVQKSTITLVKRGTSLARVSGEVYFKDDYRLVVRERLLYHCSPILIEWYGYEIWKEDQLISRYDPQPHPDETSLQISFPHHKHIQPNLNRNRIPAPSMSFNNPNIPFLIQEIKDLINNRQ